MNKFQIYPEELALVQIFGNEFEDYKSTTRRWLWEIMWCLWKFRILCTNDFSPWLFTQSLSSIWSVNGSPGLRSGDTQSMSIIQNGSSGLHALVITDRNLLTSFVFKLFPDQLYAWNE